MTWAGIALSVGCLYRSARNRPPRDWLTLSGAHLWLALPLVVAQVLFYALKAVRWRLLLKPLHSTPTRPLVAPMMIGFMATAVYGATFT